MLTNRQIEILKVIVDDYVKLAVPVGSKSLQQDHDLPYSSATIRNDMAHLEELGFIEKTHTSSGRVPSNQGYRYYVDYLIDESELDEIIKYQLEVLFNNRRLDIDEVVKQACNLISDMTNYTSVALGSECVNEFIAKVEIVKISSSSLVILIITDSGKVESRIYNHNHDLDFYDLERCVEIINKGLVGTKLCDVYRVLNDEIIPVIADYLTKYEKLFTIFLQAFVKFADDFRYISKTSNIINLPDFNDVEKIKKIVKMVEDHDFFDIVAKNIDEKAVVIGNEDNIFNVDGITMISSNYELSSDQKGVIAIIGPTRMEYDKVIKILDYVSNKITQLSKENRGDVNE